MRLLIALLLSLTLVSLCFAADISGNWKGTLKTMDGSDLEISFVFKVDGDKLTGTQTTAMDRSRSRTAW
jgi:hypothetical protein